MTPPAVGSSARSTVRAVSCTPSSLRLFTISLPSHAGGKRGNKEKSTFDLNHMPKFNFDDVPTAGHLAFNRTRELLNYARIVIHNFPQLEQHRQPYQPPPKENFLRFRSMHYQGAPHPASRKSVLVVSVKSLFSSPVFASLTGVEAAKAKRKFLHLAGTRWDPGEGVLAEPLRLDGDYLRNVPQSGTLKISCERFPTEKQNMKWCSDVLDEMIAEATNTASDEIAQMPLDVRHRIVKDLKKASGGRRRKATISDWPKHWATSASQKAS